MGAKKLLTSRAIIGEYYMRLQQGANSWVNRLAMKIDSNQASEDYAWLGMAPTMREWIGGRHAKGLRENSFRIDNKLHEATMEVSIDDIRRDASGQIMVRVGELARRTLSYPARLITTLIENGASQVCYDGQYFFDTDHSEGSSGSQSNKVTVDISALPVTNHGSTTAPSTAEMQGAILAGAQQLVGLKDDQGEPLNENATSFMIMVPTTLWAVALAAVRLPVIDSGDANTIPATNFTFEVVVNPRLTWTDRFAIFRTDADTKSMILQEELPVEIDAVAEGSELEFKERKHWYGVTWAGNVGFGFWQHAVQVILG